MSNFAKGNNSENAKGNNRKNKIIFFLIFTRLSTHYPLSAIQVCSKLLAVRVFEISSFLCSNLQRIFFNFHQVIYSFLLSADQVWSS